jgi:hypothetical protein
MKKSMARAADWFIEHERDLLGNAEFLINEGGENLLEDNGHVKYVGVDVGEKAALSGCTWWPMDARGMARFLSQTRRRTGWCRPSTGSLRIALRCGAAGGGGISARDGALRVSGAGARSFAIFERRLEDKKFQQRVWNRTSL